nr:hypothetical protein Iba_chr01cCG9860 [Ipomoea batatas]
MFVEHVVDDQRDYEAEAEGYISNELWVQSERTARTLEDWEIEVSEGPSCDVGVEENVNDNASVFREVNEKTSVFVELDEIGNVILEVNEPKSRKVK